MEIEARLVAVEKDVEYLRRSVVDHAAVAKLIEPIREEQTKQGSAITQLARDMSSMAESNRETSETVKGVLKTYNDNLVAAARAELDKAKGQTVGSVIAKVGIFMGSVTGISGGLVLIYAVIKWTLANV